MLDVIICCHESCLDVDNYVDDLNITAAGANAVVCQLHRYALPFKLVEDVSSA